MAGALVALELVLAACSTPGYLLVPRHEIGREVLSRRELEVTEQVASTTIRSSLSIEQSQTITELDRLGEPSRATRSYTTFQTSLRKGETEPEVHANTLQGSELDIRKNDQGLQVEVLKGEPSRELLKGIMILSFEYSALPKGPVAPGEQWHVDGSRLSELSALLATLGIQPSSNTLSARLLSIDEHVAHIALDWRVTSAVYGSAAMVFRLQGSMEFEPRSGLVRAVDLEGGKTDGSGKTMQQMRISIRRSLGAKASPSASQG